MQGLRGDFPRQAQKKEETFRSPLDWFEKLLLFRGLVRALDTVQSLEVVLLHDALELLAAVGAAEILGVDGGIEVDDVAASGADDLEVLVLILILAEEVVIVLVKAAVEVATGAITVALEIVVVLVEAVVILVIVLVIEVKENLLNVAQVLVQLLSEVL